MSDKKYLFKRNNVWWVKLAVPLSLRSELGYDLRRTTGEKDLDKALPIRDKIIEEFKTEFQIRKVNADDKGIVLRGTEHMQKTDISDPDQVKKMVNSSVEFLGSIDILVNNAGTNIPEFFNKIKKKVASVTQDDLNKSISLERCLNLLCNVCRHPRCPNIFIFD